MLKRLWKDEEGATMIEYALLAALISVIAVAIIGDVGTAVRDVFTDVEAELAPAAE